MTKEKRDRVAELVGDALDTVYDRLPPMWDRDFNEFVNIVEGAAREWAEACYDYPEHYIV